MCVCGGGGGRERGFAVKIHPSVIYGLNPASKLKVSNIHTLMVQDKGETAWNEIFPLPSAPP